MKQLSRESHAYALENFLVVLMIGSAIILQMRRKKYGKGKGPLLLRLMDAIPDELMPAPIGIVDKLVPRK